MQSELWHHYRSERSRLVMLTVLGVSSAVAEAGTLLALAPLMQATAEGADRYVGTAGPIALDISVTTLALIAGGLIVVALLCQLAFAQLSASTASALGERKRAEVMDAFLGATWAEQQRFSDGQLVALTTTHAQSYSGGLLLLARLYQAGISLAVFIGASLAVSFTATVVVVGCMGAVFVALRWMRSTTRLLEDQRSLNSVEMSEAVADVRDTAREVAAYGVADGAGARFDTLSTSLADLTRRIEQLTAITSPLYRSAGLLLLVGMIAYVAATRSLEIAAIAIVAVMLYRSLGYGQQFASTAQKLAGVPPFLARLQSAIDTLRSHPILEGSVEVEHVDRVDVDHVSYTYPDDDRPALEAVSFAVGVGELVGIIGPSGAGKSTLAELVLAIRHPSVGAVRFDGLDVRGLTHASRSRLTAVVSQDVPIVAGSVRDNVRFFRAIDDDAVDRALGRVGLGSWLDGLPDGAATRLGGNGRAVSGGQAQRIGIARALVGDPSLIVLDEPTSALDAATESVITELTNELRATAATIVIAHRLTTLRHCDRLVVVDDGRIVATGSLDDLRATNGFVDHAYRVGSL